MKRYPTDLNDSEWKVIENIQKDTRKRSYNLREVWNAIFYVCKGGIQWRLLPERFGEWTAIYYYFDKWKKNGLLDLVHDSLRELVRQKAGKSASPSVAIIDSQTADSSLMPCSSGAYQERGYDGNKKLKGRKRHIAVDTLGLILVVLVHSADILDRNGAVEVFKRLNEKFNGTLKKVYADQGYNGKLPKWVTWLYSWVLELVNKLEGQVGFQILPKRWVVERTFSWFEGNRRLAKDYEVTTSSEEAFVKLAMTRLMLRRFKKS
jgi:putative transposase